MDFVGFVCMNFVFFSLFTVEIGAAEIGNESKMKLCLEITGERWKNPEDCQFPLQMS